MQQREQQYLQATGGANAAEDATKQKHDELDLLFKSLFSQLDSLANFHFTPKQAQEDVTIVANVPTVRAEEGACV